MNKSPQKVKKHYYRIAVSDDLNNEIARVQGWGKSWSCLSPCRFIWHLVCLGLEEYKRKNEERVETISTGTTEKIVEALTRNCLARQAKEHSSKASGEDTWTSFFHGIKHDGNIIYPVWD